MPGTTTRTFPLNPSVPPSTKYLTVPGSTFPSSSYDTMDNYKEKFHFTFSLAISSKFIVKKFSKMIKKTPSKIPHQHSIHPATRDDWIQSADDYLKAWGGEKELRNQLIKTLRRSVVLMCTGIKFLREFFDSTAISIWWKKRSRSIERIRLHER